VEVWIAWHIPSSDGHGDKGVGDPLLLGVYSSVATVQLAVIRLSELPGFRDNPEITPDPDSPGFFIEAYRLDEDHWTSGFRRADDA
jgi:hypothetical protein